MRERFKKLWATYRHISAVRSLLQWIGLWKYVVGLADIALTTGLGWLVRTYTGAPMAVLIPTSLCVFGIILFAAYIIAIMRASAHGFVAPSTGTALPASEKMKSGNLSLGQVGPVIRLHAGSSQRITPNTDWFYIPITLVNEWRSPPDSVYGVKAAIQLLSDRNENVTVDPCVLIRRDLAGSPEFVTEVDTLKITESVDLALVAWSDKQGVTAVQRWLSDTVEGGKLDIGEWKGIITVAGRDNVRVTKEFWLSVKPHYNVELRML